MKIYISLPISGHDIEDDNNSTRDSIFHVSNLQCEFYAADVRPSGYPLTFIVNAEYAHDGKRYPLGFSDELLSY